VGLRNYRLVRSCHDFQTFNLCHRPEFNEYVNDMLYFRFKLLILISSTAILPDYRRISLGSPPKLKLPMLCVFFPHLNPKCHNAHTIFFTFFTLAYPSAPYRTSNARLPPLPTSLLCRSKTIPSWFLPIPPCCTPNNPRGDSEIERKSRQTQDAICGRTLACTIWSVTTTTFAWSRGASRPSPRYACCR
jgi:hypothetical protein